MNFQDVHSFKSLISCLDCIDILMATQKQRMTRKSRTKAISNPAVYQVQNLTSLSIKKSTSEKMISYAQTKRFQPDIKSDQQILAALPVLTGWRQLFAIFWKGSAQAMQMTIQNMTKYK